MADDERSLQGDIRRSGDEAKGRRGSSHRDRATTARDREGQGDVAAYASANTSSSPSNTSSSPLPSRSSSSSTERKVRGGDSSSTAASTERQRLRGGTTASDDWSLMRQRLAESERRVAAFNRSDAAVPATAAKPSPRVIRQLGPPPRVVEIDVAVDRDHNRHGTPKDGGEEGAGSFATTDHAFLALPQRWAERGVSSTSAPGGATLRVQDAPLPPTTLFEFAVAVRRAKLHFPEAFDDSSWRVAPL